MPAMPSNWPRSTHRRHGDLQRVDHRQARAHVDVGAVGHRVVERQDRVGERFDRGRVGAIGMVALEDRAHECAVDRAALGSPGTPAASCAAAPASGCLRRSRRRRRAPGATRARDGAARTARRAARPTRCRRSRKLAIAARAKDVVGGRGQVVGAVGDVAGDVALLVAAAIALHVDAPADEAALGEPVHHRRVGPARHGEVEGRLRGHRRAVHEQHRRLALGRADELLPQEQAHVAVGGLLVWSSARWPVTGVLMDRQGLSSFRAREARQSILAPVSWITRAQRSRSSRKIGAEFGRRGADDLDADALAM